jgi:hypothetical protein
MKTYCSVVRVKDEAGQQVLRWSEPWFGSLVVKQENGRVIIERKGLFGKKTYLPSINESVEADSASFWKLI